MNYRSSRSLVMVFSWVLAALGYSILCFIIGAGMKFQGRMALAFVLFLAFFIARRYITKELYERLYKKAMGKTESKLVLNFVERLRTCFTMTDFIHAIREGLEKPLDASLVLIRSNTWEEIYSSPASLTADPGLILRLKRNYRELSEGFVFLDEKLELSLKLADARGFFILCKGYYFFVFSRICPYVDEDAYRVLHGELSIFFDRALTVSKLFEIAALTKEWQQIAKTQRSFLPAKLPDISKLELANYWRPLLNVSGDYYDVIKLDDSKTLLVIGDISGKGLAAALVTGIVLNTIRAAKEKADLKNLVKVCDEAIRGMGFEDKYTVMCLFLLDTESKTIKYINAAMPDQFLVVRTVKGAVIRRLPSNCGIIGLVPIDNLEVEEVELRTDDVLVLSTDGLLEIQDAEGLNLDQSPDFEKLLLSSHEMDAETLVERLATFGETSVTDSSLNDDITILAAKVGRLWD